MKFKNGIRMTYLDAMLRQKPLGPLRSDCASGLRYWRCPTGTRNGGESARLEIPSGFYPTVTKGARRDESGLGRREEQSGRLTDRSRCGLQPGSIGPAGTCCSSSCDPEQTNPSRHDAAKSPADAQGRQHPICPGANVAAKFDATGQGDRRRSVSVCSTCELY